jgi:sterol 14-demethylase
MTTPPIISGGSLPFIGQGLSFLREPLELLERGYREHGRVFGLKLGGKRMAVVLGPELNELFFRETDQRLSIRAGYPFFARMFSDRLYFLADKDEYQEQRQFVLPMFKGPQLHAYIPMMLEEIERLMTALGDEGELELVHTFGTLVMNIAIRCFLGRGFRERLGDRFFDIFRDFSAGMDPVLPGWLPLPHLLRSARAKKRLHQTLQGVIDERRQMASPPDDFLQRLVDGSYTSGNKIPDKVIIDLILLMSWAGHETTAGHTSWAIIDILQHPEIAQRLRDEQNAAWADDSAPLEMAHLNELKVLERALKETERLHPVAFVLIRQAIEDIPLPTGHVLPKGWMVAISPWISHRLPEVFEAPERFDPDRFLPERGEKLTNLVGFGGGVHRCAGVNFAYLEMKVIVTVLLRHYELELLDKDPQPIRGSHTKWPESPCRVRYHRIARGAGPVAGERLVAAG